MPESFVKYLSGLIDADGSICFNFVNPTKDGFHNLSLKISISAARSVDVHDLVFTLPDTTGFGTAHRYGDADQYARWTVTSRRDLEMLSPRLVKHMVVKARHLQRMLDKWREMRGVPLSEKDCEELRKFSAASRTDAGPLKPKNHPTWAWLAGYLDGNGCYRAGKCKSGHYNGKQSYRMQCSVQAACHVNDISVLEFIKKAHGGYIKKHSKSDNCMIWERNLGKSQHSFAIRFLPDVVKHARMKKHKIEQMIHLHHLQRLSASAPEGEATV